MEQLKQVLIEIIGLSEESASALIDEFGELAAQRHAMHCWYAMDKGKVKNPPAWFTASLKHDWSAPYGMPLDWLPSVLHFRIDENTFVEFECEMRKEKQNAPYKQSE
jgi:hypothetical protein